MSNWRLNILTFFVFVLAAITISRLFYIQILNHKFYQAQILGQQAGFREIKGERGQVFLSNSKDSKGNIDSEQVKSLAVNQDSWLIYAVAQKIEDKDKFAKTLSENITESKDFILSKLGQSDSYVIIKKNLTEEKVNSLKELNIESLYFENNPERYYPQKEITSHVIGFLGGDGIGQYGVEGYYNSLLEGKEGIEEQKKGLDLINQPEDSLYLNGSDVYLTIDYNIQFQAEALLKEAKKNLDMESGQIIVLKPDSGRIVALANYPSFDPNKYSRENNFEIFQNSAIQKIFEPGSIFKPLTMAIALQENKITPETTFTDTGSVKIGPDTVYNFDKKIYGHQTMSGILEKSINTGAVFLSQSISNDKFFDYVDKFGLNEKTEIDLQGEVSSRNEVLKNGSEFGFATAAFGQGIEMTPIQLAKAFCIFANDGKLVKPYVVSKIVHGQEEFKVSPKISSPVISEKTASEVTKMLINVVEKGFGSEARVPGYYLAGKTGTAQVPLINKKGYDPNKTIQSFIGFGPALKPEFLILVKLDNPKVSASALSAAPIFRKLSKYIIDYWQIPPDY
ncbi:MAG: penicillin-binding protein 2 [Patescibacteria group bacterium]